jgi:hypothetical protein
MLIGKNSFTDVDPKPEHEFCGLIYDVGILMRKVNNDVSASKSAFLSYANRR